jgi:Mg2+ and Co2+ transporter CorA
MVAEHTIDGVTWIDLTNPTKEDILRISGKYDLSLPVDTVLDFDLAPQIQSTHDTTYCVLRFPRLYKDRTHEHRTSFELDTLITPNLLVTFHDISLFEIGNVINNNKNDRIPTSPTTPLSLFGLVIAEFLATVRKQLREISTQSELLEMEIFQSAKKDTTHTVAKVAKHLIDIERSLMSNTPVINKLASHNESVKSHNLAQSIESFNEISYLLQTNRVIIEELRKTHQNFISQNTTSAIRNLSVITFLTLPLSVLVDTLNVYSNPQVFLMREVILIGIGLFTVTLLVYFRKRNML